VFRQDAHYLATIHTLQTTVRHHTNTAYARPLVRSAKNELIRHAGFRETSVGVRYNANRGL